MYGNVLTRFLYGSGQTETGMCRLSLTDSDKEARDWFVQKTKSLGCQVTIDAMGNIFAVRPGRREAPPTFAGSHLDTQPRGGRYDGILGVLSGVEMLQVLNDHAIETEFPVGVVNWTKLVYVLSAFLSPFSQCLEIFPLGAAAPSFSFLVSPTFKNRRSSPVAYKYLDTVVRLPKTIVMDKKS